MPKGYIVITEDVKDPAGMAEYGKLASKAMAGATVLAFDTKAETIEGQWHGSQTVLLEFESVEQPRSGITRRPTRRRSRCVTPRRTATASSSRASSRYRLLLDDRDRLPGALPDRFPDLLFVLRGHVVGQHVQVIVVVDLEHLGMMPMHTALLSHRPKSTSILRLIAAP